MGIYLGIMVVISAALVFGFRIATRRSFQRGRNVQELTEIHALVSNEISLDVFKEVWLKVGEAFSIDPRLIKPEESLDKLSEVDSWDLGEGGDALSDWLHQKQLGPPPLLRTVLDIARWVQRAKTTPSEA